MVSKKMRIIGKMKRSFDKYDSLLMKEKLLFILLFHFHYELSLLTFFFCYFGHVNMSVTFQKTRCTMLLLLLLIMNERGRGFNWVSLENNWQGVSDSQFRSRLSLSFRVSPF